MGFFERAAAAPGDVLFGEGTLGGAHLGDRFRERALLRAAAIENAGFVEMDVGVDEARRHEAAADVFRGRVGRDGRSDLGNAPAGHADVERRAVAAGDAGIAEDEIEPHGLLLLRRKRRSVVAVPSPFGRGLHGPFSKKNG